MSSSGFCGSCTSEHIHIKNRNNSSLKRKKAVYRLSSLHSLTSPHAHFANFWQQPSEQAKGVNLAMLSILWSDWWCILCRYPSLHLLGRNMSLILWPALGPGCLCLLCSASSPHPDSFALWMLTFSQTHIYAALIVSHLPWVSSSFCWLFSFMGFLKLHLA